MSSSFCTGSSFCSFGMHKLMIKRAEGDALPQLLETRNCYFVLKVFTSLSVTPPFPSLATTFQ